MTTTYEEIGRFLAKSEEKTIEEFMDIAGLGEEYRKSEGISEIKSILEKFAERGYLVDMKKLPDKIDDPNMKWRISLLLDGNEIIHRNITVRINTIRRQ